jgi:outer membrane protein assembly factor BamB
VNLVSDAKGNVYVTGTVNLGSPPQDYAVTVKYDPSGKILWKDWLGTAPFHPAQARDIALNPDGHIDVLVTIDPGFTCSGQPCTPPSAEIDLATYNPDGTRDEHFFPPGTGQFSTNPSKLAVSPLGNIYLTGVVENAAKTGSQALTMKLNSRGIRSWTRLDPTPIAGFNMPNGIGIDAGENVYLSVGSTHFLPTIYKFDTAGTLVKSFSSDKFGTNNMIRVDGNGNIYVAACYAPGPVVAKFDTTGNQLWIHNFKATRCFSDLKVDSHGAVILAETLSPAAPRSTAGVVKLDANGNLQWESLFGSSAAQNFTENLAIDSSDQIYLLAVTGINTSAGAVTIKYSPDGQQLWAQPFPAQPQGGIVPTALVLGPANRVIVTALAQNNPNGATDILSFAYDQTTP